MPEPAPRVHLFARDWDHAAWTESFYPPDLPDDWRLSYYANEFRGVLVSAGRWQRATEDALPQWADDVHDAFRFYLESAQAPVTPQDEAKAALLGSCFGGWVLPQPEQAGQGLTPCRSVGLPVGHQAFLLDADALGDLKAQRHLLERLASENGAARALLLFLQGEAWPLERLRQLAQLSQLLGLA